MNNKLQKSLFSISLLVILIMSCFDIKKDISEGLGPTHFIIEIVICALALISLIILFMNNLGLNKNLITKTSELDLLKIESEIWKNKNSEYIAGLSRAIDQQLGTWGLSPSEKEIALLILKGLSLKDIAEIRSVSERTVRQQSTNIYQKSNLSGRAELSAFFLEDLLK